jgi:transcription elongation factor GreA
VPLHATYRSRRGATSLVVRPIGSAWRLVWTASGVARRSGAGADDRGPAAPGRGERQWLNLNLARGRLESKDHHVQKFPMTAPGLQRLEEELRQLKAQERPAIIRAIAEARAHGDLSENAEYHAARERQSFIEGRIAELEEITSAAEVIDPSTLSGDHVKFGAHVWLVDEETEKEATYQIVGVHEADVKVARLSISSPLAKALIGKKVGDTISVPAPGGDRSYEILGIKYI